MALAIFDLDNTLIGGDSDHLWGEFLCEQELVDASAFAARNDQFYADYKAGNLDIERYLRFALGPLKNQPQEVLEQWHREFMNTKIEPILLPAAMQLIARHREQGDDLLIITATNAFITTPIARALGIPDILASEAEMVNGRYTGRPTGTPSYKEGKITRLKDWLRSRETGLEGAWFYSDSHNDLPLLQQVDRPVAVDPDDILLAHAREAGWPVISLRD